MAKYKGSGLVILRKMLEQKGPNSEQEFLSLLNPDEQLAYKQMTAMSWLPVDMAAAIFSKATKYLFPGNNQGLRQIGRFTAQDHLTGIYKILLRIATVNFVIEQAAKLWSTYFDQGRAWVDHTENHKRVIFKVENFPELPPANREVVSGFILGALELSNARNVKVMLLGDDPKLWRWDVTWI